LVDYYTPPEGSYRPQSVTELTPGTTIERCEVLDVNRGYVKSRRFVILERRRYNLLVDDCGSTNWLYWLDVKHQLLIIPKRVDEKS
jgi:hypothetical protein